MTGEKHPNIPISRNGWEKWGKHVLAELERQDKCIMKLIEQITELKIELAILKIKSGIWGAIGAIIPILIAIIIWLLRDNIFSQ